MKRDRGILFVVSAPSGAGKTTLCRRLSDVFGDIGHSVSYTTRGPRPGEINGTHYHFVDEAEFRDMIGKGVFVEWAEVHGNFYGTSREQIEGMVSSGVDVLLDIDVQGGKQIRQHFSDSVLVFILPPSMDTLKARLVGRMSDHEDVIERRLLKACDEMREYKNYNYVIVNDVLERAQRELESIVIAERLKIARFNKDLIKEYF